MKRFAFAILALSLLLLANASHAADYTITNEPAGPPIVGFGAEMNPYLHCTPNAEEISPLTAEAYERKVLALAPQHVRIFVLQHWFDGRADGVSKGDPRTKDSLYCAIDLAQRAGATVNLTLWFGPWPEPEKAMKAFAGVLQDIIINHKLSAVQYVTVQNEVNGTEKITIEHYNRLYRALDVSLKEIGLRGRIKIIGGDLVQTNQQAWIENLGKNLSDVCDGYSNHAYWDYWDTNKLMRRVTEVPRFFAALPPAQQRPLYLTEFGVRGHRKNPKHDPGDFEDGTPIAKTPLHAMQIAWFMMEAINRGYVAAVVWTMEDAHYDYLMFYGLMGTVKEGWAEKPAYRMLQLFTHTSKPGWCAAKIDGSAEGTVVSALRGPKDELSVYALNKTDKPQKVTIAGLPAKASFRQMIWNQKGTGQTTDAAAIVTKAGANATLSLPPLGLVVLTNVPARSSPTDAR